MAFAASSLTMLSMACAVESEILDRGTEKEIVLCVIKQAQIVTLKRLVKDIDERAFMIVSDSREVFGEGFSYIGSD